MLDLTDGSLRAAVDRLVAADKALVAVGSGGGTGAATTATKAAKRAVTAVDELCPTAT